MPKALTWADMAPGLLEVVEKHESHHRKSRMVDISSSGSGEGPGRVTARPTLQRPFPPRPPRVGVGLHTPRRTPWVRSTAW